MVGLAGAMLAADVVGMFEERLQVNILFAFFVPGIVYLADAVGTQTETIVVRGLSLGVPIGRMISRELLAGLAMVVGATIGGGILRTPGEVAAQLPNAAVFMAVWAFGASWLVKGAEWETLVGRGTAPSGVAGADRPLESSTISEG